MANLPYNAKDLIWLADTKETVSNFPAGAKRPIGFGLRLVQNGQPLSSPYHSETSVPQCSS